MKTITKSTLLAASVLRASTYATAQELSFIKEGKGVAVISLSIETEMRKQ